MPSLHRQRNPPPPPPLPAHASACARPASGGGLAATSARTRPWPAASVPRGVEGSSSHPSPAAAPTLLLPGLHGGNAPGRDSVLRLSLSSSSLPPDSVVTRRMPLPGEHQQHQQQHLWRFSGVADNAQQSAAATRHWHNLNVVLRVVWCGGLGRMRGTARVQQLAFLPRCSCSRSGSSTCPGTRRSGPGPGLHTRTQREVT